MKKIVPFNADFQYVSKSDSVSMLLLCLSIVVSAGLIVIAKLTFSQKELTLEILVTISCILSIGYFIADIVCNYLFQKAEEKRRNDFFDNSLNTNFSHQNSENYFSNDTLRPGIVKMGINCFENSFFTTSVARKMLPANLFKVAIIVTLFLCVALSDKHDLLVVALQMALPFTIIQQTLRLFIFSNRMETICNDFQQMFFSVSSDHLPAFIIRNTVKYESILAWACIKLDSKVFNKHNDRLSKEWESIKGKIAILNTAV